MRLLQVPDGPGQDLRQPVVAARGHRALDELALPTLALRRDDHPPGDGVGDAAAELAAHQVQARVDAGRGAGAGDEVAVVDEQHVRVHLGQWEACGELGGVPPVGGAPAPVEQPGRPEDERARAHAEQDGAGRVRRPQGLEQGWRVGLLLAGGGHHHEVRAHQPVEPERRHHLHAHPGGERLPGHRPAHPELERGHALFGAIDPEDLAGDAELEQRQLVDQQGRDGSQHGSTLMAGSCRSTAYLPLVARS